MHHTSTMQGMRNDNREMDAAPIGYASVLEGFAHRIGASNGELARVFSRLESMRQRAFACGITADSGKNRPESGGNVGIISDLLDAQGDLIQRVQSALDEIERLA